MNFLTLHKNKTIKLDLNENIYVGDNDITKIQVKLPLTVNEYDITQCTVELRAVFPHLNQYISYNIDTAKTNNEFLISNELTVSPQIIDLLMIIRKDNTIIGQTNAEKIEILPSKSGDKEITPREEWEQRIQELETEIENKNNTIHNLNRDIGYLNQTINEKTEEITQQGEQITELNGEVIELETQHTADQNTIQYLIDNPPEAHLQPKSVTPTNQMQVVEPDEGYQGLSTVTVGATTPPRLQSKQVAPSESTTYVTADSDYDGLSSVTVDNVTASIDPNIQPENIKKDVVIVGVEGTYDPFPEHSVGGIYITEVDEEGYPVKFLIKNFGKTVGAFPIIYQNNSIAKSRIKQFIFENCVDINYIHINNAVSGYFDRMVNIVKIELPENLLRLDGYMFNNCLSLKQINIPATLSTIMGTAFYSCSSLENVTIKNGFNCNNLNLSSSTLYSAATIVSWLNALADRTGQTAYTLTIGSTNLNKLTAEQKAIATNKNWNLN